MTCPRCQSPNPPGTTICPSCGFALRGARASGGGGAQSKGLAIASLVLGVISICTFAGLGIGALVGTVLGIVALVKANNSPATHGGKGLAIAGIVTSVLSVLAIPLIGIVAAIAIPSLLRARVSANESAAIGDIRTVISAEAAYQSSNSGYYDNLECLNGPVRCIPGYPATGPTFIDSSLLQTVKTGYRRSFHAGQAVVAAPAGASISPSSIESYAYVAEPVTPNQTGVRAFCGDSSGMICQTQGSMPTPVNGLCPSDCNPLF